MAIKLKLRRPSVLSSPGNWLPPKSVRIMIYLPEPLVHSWWRQKAVGGLNQIPALLCPAVCSLTRCTSLANEKALFPSSSKHIHYTIYTGRFESYHFLSEVNDALYVNRKKNTVTHSWFQTSAVLWVLYFLFWVFFRRLNFISRRFGTLCQLHLHRWCGHTTYEDVTDSVPKRRPKIQTTGIHPKRKTATVTRRL